MVRPRIRRTVRFSPEINYFKPVGVKMLNLAETILSVEELEAIRLIDYENIGQAKAAKMMKISQPTLSRILLSARKKISGSLINGQAIKIQGGDFKMAVPRGRGLGIGKGRGVSGRGRMGGFAAGPGGICKCPKCNYQEPQVRGVPCTSKKCPKCGSNMIRNL